jgi:hypothetical protein
MNPAVAVSNARDATVELGRRRIEREAVDVFVAQKNRIAARRRSKSDEDRGPLN